jgi:DNA-binding CsgD family transcriptional regulator
LAYAANVGFRSFTTKTAHARTVADLAKSVLDEAGELVGARGVGLYVFEGSIVNAKGVPTKLLSQYEKIGRDNDPVLAIVKRQHAPCAAPIAELRKYGRANGLPDGYMELLDYNVGHHYMLAPVLVDGEVIGTLNFARAEDREFGVRELSIASALALHVSTRMAVLKAQKRTHADRSWESVLTARGFEVAQLAARGLTTDEVGRALGVSANTVKKHLRNVYDRLAISSRAELATMLARPAP